jgi:hypothetical protein
MIPDPVIVHCGVSSGVSNMALKLVTASDSDVATLISVIIASVMTHWCWRTIVSRVCAVARSVIGIVGCGCTANQ